MNLHEQYEESLKEYVSFYALTRAVSTVNKVKCILRRFLRECKVLELESLIEWREVQMNRVSPLAGSQQCGVIHGFLNWMVEEGRLLVNPLPVEWIRPKFYPKVRQVPSQRELENLLKYENDSFGEIFPNRNRALVELAYALGLRRAELRSLNLCDVEGGTLRVIGKGNKERLLPLPQSSKKKIQIYLKSEREVLMGGKSEKALFVSQRRKRLSLTTISVIFKNQIKSDLTPHQFRHACASHMLQNGCSLRVLQKYLGHESLESTQLYTRVDLGDLREMLGKCHPRGLKYNL